MQKPSSWLIVGFLTGLGLGCATTAVVAQDSAPAPGSVAAQENKGPVGKVVGPQSAVMRFAPNGKATARLYATGQQAFVGTLTMDAGAAVPQHQDPTEEFIYVVSGSGEITIDGVTTAVGPKSVIYMPAGATVSYKNGDQPLEAVQIFADPGPEAKYDKWSPDPIVP